MGKKCSVEGCDRPSRTRTWCAAHYGRWFRTGSTGGADIRAIVTGKSRVELRKYITENAEQTANGCWEWTRFIRGDGYGQLKVVIDGEKFVMAHRVSHSVFNEPIPDGMVVDHICFNRACVNPDHLRAVSTAGNNQNRQGATSASSSGVRGVSWSKKDKRWVVQACADGKYYWGGGFTDIREAEDAAVRLRAEVQGVTSRADANYLARERK